WGGQGRSTLSLEGQFPRPSLKPGQVDRASEESLHLDVQKLKEKEDMLDKEITQLLSEGYSVDELEDHISQLHEYNDIKDVAQMLLGRLENQIPHVTTKSLQLKIPCAASKTWCSQILKKRRKECEETVA
ncbi:hypothetical protein FD754_007690, partial [Muntiacus muntjak]